MKIFQVIISFLCIIYVAESQSEFESGEKEIRLTEQTTIAKTSWRIAFEHAERCKIKLDKAIEEKLFPDGHLVKVYQLTYDRKKVGNHMAFRFNNDGVLISIFDKLAYDDSQIFERLNTLPKVEKNNSGNRSLSCVSSTDIVSIDIEREYPGSGILTYNFEDALKVVGSDNNYTLCHDNITSNLTHPLSNLEITYKLDDGKLVPNDNNIGDEEKMIFYHLSNSSDLFHSKFSSVYPAVDYRNILFDIFSINSNSPQIGSSVNASNEIKLTFVENSTYQSIGLDAYPIVSAYVQAMINFDILKGNELSSDEGISWAVGDYFAHKYMKENDFADESIMYEFGGLGVGGNSQAWRPLDINFAYLYSSEIYDNLRPGKDESQLLSTVFEVLSSPFGVGEDKTDLLILNSLLILTEVESQAEAAAAIYLTDANLTDDERCRLFRILENVYREDFIVALEGFGEIVPIATSKDYLIRDSYQGQLHKEHGI